MRITEVFGGKVPETMEDLLTLPGVARKTANVVLGTAFGMNEGVVVDTHVQRLSQRMGLTKEHDPAKVEQDLMALFPREEWTDLSHRLILHGRQVCNARLPRCEACVLGPDACPSYQPEAAGWKSGKAERAKKSASRMVGNRGRRRRWRRRRRRGGAAKERWMNGGDEGCGSRRGGKVGVSEAGRRCSRQKAPSDRMAAVNTHDFARVQAGRTPSDHPGEQRAKEMCARRKSMGMSQRHWVWCAFAILIAAGLLRVWRRRSGPPPSTSTGRSPASGGDSDRVRGN